MMEYEENYYDDEYFPQDLGCLPMALVVVGAAMLLIVALSRVEIRIPAAEEAAVNESFMLCVKDIEVVIEHP